MGIAGGPYEIRFYGEVKDDEDRRRRWALWTKRRQDRARTLALGLSVRGG
jgi:hypothetical protein